MAEVSAGRTRRGPMMAHFTLQEFSRFVRVAATACWRAERWNVTMGDETWADLTTR